MFFNVSQLLLDAPGATRMYTVDDAVPGARPDMLPADVRGAVRLMRTNRGLFAHADLEATARDTCSRCLGPTETPVQLTIDEEFLPTVDVYTGQPLPPRDPVDEAAFSIDDHHHVDLTEAVRQALVVEEPMRPLCRSDCAGLCSTCGADLNQGACGCATEPAENRWAALRDLQINET